MMRVESVAVTDDEGRVFRLDYSVCIAERSDAYRLKIECASDFAGLVSSEETPGLTHDRLVAEEWARRLAAGRVMPVHLFNIVDEFFIE